MGCVLGKTADRRSKSTVRRSKSTVRRDRAEEPQSTAANDTKTVENVEEVRSDGARVDKTVEKRIRQAAVAGDARAAEGRRLKKEYSLNAAPAWPQWLSDVAGDVIRDWTPRRANSFEKLDKIGQGTYSNVYKARDLITGKIVALKKVRVDTLEPENVKFMAREILILKKLNHPNVIKLEGLVTSRMSSSLYLVFEYMEHDLAGLAATQGVKFTEPQVKCFIKQLLSGLDHCHKNGVLHRDIKGSNLLIDNDGILKIADFGLACFYDPQNRQPMTSRVVTLWYRPPELLLGATYYGVGVDMWSAGCILAELLAGKPIMPGRTEVEQLHKIFKLCGSPSEEYWKKYRLPNTTLFKPRQPYKRCTKETFKDFPTSSLPLLESLLAIDPDERVSAAASLSSDFFSTEPYACEPSELPKYPPSKELDVKLRDEEARRQRGLSAKSQAGDGNKKPRTRERAGRAIPAPEANAEIQSNVDRWRGVNQSDTKSKSEKFPPPHRDAAVGHPLDMSHNGRPVSFGTDDGTSFSSSVFDSKSSKSVKEPGTMDGLSTRKHKRARSQTSSRKFIRAFLPSTISLNMDLRFKSKEAVFRNRR
ncbi:putative protein-serine/threonine kinase CMGC-CDK-CRK7-CDK9 family [Helianthus annuus]|nr:putative protein-serine/threonine kinase CMGC-CDK-CRK7-CDK9 family [Helianthus annuus]KAJ0458674.1 putative protein-serine/threonine kinase CMGC-CDK-CRK7-CDK9 family [Helianthus annuus]KAJ0639206.1 putative protein-serine/threonine kinase CMGC-CDK-CRK7-CDK9 family [Helianthus annuus]KAJ0643173.1 putative protein-serine/threonine kinase CMGC-CDK-CRK7-CDK9 family [Helianthus annuus]KAJ0819301.1 putative protein-serine/threonine kinase CMGC-CDK-CRK7-CDK9 family [Helianthus annuus]